MSTPPPSELQRGHAARPRAPIPDSSPETCVARLLIRAGRAARSGRAVNLAALWHRMLGHPLPPLSASDPAALQVEVAAQQGRHLFVLRNPEGTVEMSVGPGTYDITVVHGSRRRRYTVPLEPGATFNLDLHDAQAP